MSLFLGQKLASLKPGIMATLTPLDSEMGIGVGLEKGLLEPDDGEGWVPSTSFTGSVRMSQFLNFCTSHFSHT